MQATRRRLQRLQDIHLYLVRISFYVDDFTLSMKHCVVPLGFLSDATEPTPNPPTPLHDKAPGMPFGLCFMGTAYSEYQLIGFAYAFEQATRVRLTRKAFTEAIPKTQLKDVVSS